MGAIYNFRKVSDMLACAGQPREEQLQDIANGGYKVLINLGLSDGKYALKDEAISVKALGMQYHHIPVNFEAPQTDDLAAFISLMNAHANEKTFVHCAANYRASVFTGLYLLGAGKFTEEEMKDFIEEIWQPDPVWEQFLEEGIAYIKKEQ